MEDPKDVEKLNRHDQIIEALNTSNKQLFNITSKLNGEYLKADKQIGEFKIYFGMDLEFLKKKANTIEDKLNAVIDGYVKREEFETRFHRLQEEIDGRIIGANDRIDTKTDTDKFDESYKNIQISLNELKDNQKWITRLIIGGVVSALLGLVLLK